MWLATPSSYDSFIHDTSPVFIGAIGLLTCLNYFLFSPMLLCIILEMADVETATNGASSA
jgi:hypothetical protein